MEEESKVTNQDILNAINNLNTSTQKTNESINELTEYLIAKDKADKTAQETEAKQASEKAEEQAELEEQAKKDEASAAAEQSASADAQAETYTELLTSIDEGIQLNNQLLAVQGIYIGIVIGLLFIKIFFDKLTKR